MYETYFAGVDYNVVVSHDVSRGASVSVWSLSAVSFTVAL